MKQRYPYLSTIAISLLAVASWIFVEQPWAAEPKNVTNPYLDLYQQSVQNMARPDVDLRAVMESDQPLAAVAAPTSSRTCSQRCSQRCSVSCTTTRGCSSGCKAYTDGCGGSPTPGKNSNVTSPTTKGATAAPAPTPITKGSFTVRDVQMMLNIVGYDVTIDGSMGPTTKAAIEHFQKSKSMTVTGVASSDLWRALCLQAVGMGE